MAELLAPKDIFHCEPHLVDPKTGYRMWLTDPLGFMGEPGKGVTVLDDATADFICSVGEQVIARGGPGNKHIALHDWGGIATYTEYARQRLSSFLMEHRKDTAECGLVLSRSNPFARATGLAVGAALRLAGFHITIGSDIELLIAKFQLKAAKQAA